MGVNGDDTNTCNFTISISKYKCPMNCNNRGVCQVSDNGTRTCDCDKVSTDLCLTLSAMLGQQLIEFWSERHFCAATNHRSFARCPAASLMSSCFIIEGEEQRMSYKSVMTC